MNLVFDERLSEKEIQREAYSITKDVFDYCLDSCEYLGIKGINKNNEEITDSPLYKDIIDVLRFIHLGEKSEKLLAKCDKIKKLLTLSPYQKIWNNNLDTFLNTILGDAIHETENTNYRFAEFITQAEASRILGKDASFVSNMIHHFDPIEENGKVFVRKSKVLEYKEKVDYKQKFIDNPEYMNGAEIAEYLNISKDLGYKLLKSQFADYLEEDVNYVKREVVEKYKQEKEEGEIKYNIFDYISSKESAYLFGVAPQTVSQHWSKNGKIKGVEMFLGDIKIPIDEVIRILDERGKKGKLIIEARNGYIFQITNIFINAYNNNLTNIMDEIKEEAKDRGFSGYVWDLEQKLKKGEEVYIPERILKENLVHE